VKIETVIFGNLVENEEYARKVIPYLKSEYFIDNVDRVIFDLIDEYVKKYNTFPTKEAIAIDLSARDGLSEDQFAGAKNIITNLTMSADRDIDWLLDNTEKFCKDKALYNALMQSIRIVDDKKDSISVGAIPEILSAALGVSFDTSIGHDFIEDSDARYEFYHRKESKIPFDIEYLNKITGGGLSKKTLNIVMAGTGAGKSLFMCHCAASNLMNGYNVLYITLEGSANFRHLINELKLKKNFVPDIIYIDYLNICSSSRIKSGSNVNSYTLIKAIAEELRGLAVECNVPIVSATQTTRSGSVNSDVDLTDTSESFGLPATADFMIALIVSEELDDLGQIMIKQLKNRYGDPSVYKRFVVGIDRAKMKLYDVENSAQDDIMDDKPVFDNSLSGIRLGEESKPVNKFRHKFKGFS